MKNIRDLIKADLSLSDDQIMTVFKEIGSVGDIILFKNDGVRTEKKFTVVIMSGNGKFDSIRCDSNDLYTAVRNALIEYDHATAFI